MKTLIGEKENDTIILRNIADRAKWVNDVTWKKKKINRTITNETQRLNNKRVTPWRFRHTISDVKRNWFTIFPFSTFIQFSEDSLSFKLKGDGIIQYALGRTYIKYEGPKAHFNWNEDEPSINWFFVDVFQFEGLLLMVTRFQWNCFTTYHASFFSLVFVWWPIHWRAVWS